MSTGRPFDPLGRILREGGDRQLANALARGNFRQESLLVVRWSDWGATESDIGTVTAIANQAVEAGRELTVAGLDDAINFSIIPVNPLLFGDDSGGLRFYVSTDFQLSTTGIWYRADFKFADLYSTSEIVEAMSETARQWVIGSPRRFKTADGNDVNIMDYAIQTIIGKF